MDPMTDWPVAEADEPLCRLCGADAAATALSPLAAVAPQLGDALAQLLALKVSAREKKPHVVAQLPRH